LHVIVNVTISNISYTCIPSVAPLDIQLHVIMKIKSFADINSFS
jgi:hypothetical protein